MKKLFFLIASLAVMTACAQNGGSGISYYNVMTDEEGMALPDTVVNLKVSIYRSPLAGIPLWVETHTVHTDDAGRFGIIVGKGVRDKSSCMKKFSKENLSDGLFWIRTEIREDDKFRELYTSPIIDCEDTLDDGSTFFVLPDIRSRFLRNTSNDSINNLNTY